jgi:tetratricopeptide (TPR) repeat protein
MPAEAGQEAVPVPAVTGKWQVPLFLAGLLLFAFSLMMYWLVPEPGDWPQTEVLPDKPLVVEGGVEKSHAALDPMPQPEAPLGGDTSRDAWVQKVVADAVRLGDALLELGKTEEAVARYEGVLKQIPRIPEDQIDDWLDRSGWKKFMEERYRQACRGNYALAVALKQLIIGSLPESERLEHRFALAELHEEEAGRLQRQADSDGASKMVELQEAAAAAYRKAGISYWELREHHPDAVRLRDVLFQGGLSFYKGGAYGRAIRLWRDFLQVVPGDRGVSEVYFRLGDSYKHLSDFETAQDMFQRNVERIGNEREVRPDIWTVRSWLQVALCNERSGKWVQAEQTYLDILGYGHLSPESEIWQEALFNLGILYEQWTGQEASRERELLLRSAARLEEYLQRYPAAEGETGERYRQALRVKALSEMRLQRWDRAAQDWKRLAEVTTDDGTAWVWVGHCLQREERLQESEVAYRAGYDRLRSLSDRLAVLYRLVELYRATGRAGRVPELLAEMKYTGGTLPARADDEDPWERGLTSWRLEFMERWLSR